MRAAILLLSLGCTPALLPGQTAGNLRSGAESYSDSLPGESANGLSLQFDQLLPVGGAFSGDAILVNRAGQSGVGRWGLRLRDLPLGDLRLGADGGDILARMDAAPFHFPNDYMPTALLRGVQLRAESRTLAVSAFGGRNELFRGVRLPTTEFAPESFLGAAGSYLPSDWLTLDFSTLDTRNHRESENPLFGVPVAREAHTYGLGFTARPAPIWLLSARGSAASYTYDPGSIYQSGHFFSWMAGSELETAGWKAQADFVHQGVNYLPLSTGSVGNREGPYALVQYGRGRYLIYGSFASYRNNLEESPDVPDLRSRSLQLGSNLRLGSAVMLGGSYSQQNLTSSQTGVSSEFLQRTAAAELSFPSFGYTRLRYQRQMTDEPTLNQRLDEIELEQRPPPFHGVSVSAGARFQHTAVGASSLLYRGGIDGSVRDIHVYLDGEWGRDLASSSVFALNRNQTIRFGLSAPLPGALELHVEGYRNRLTSVVNTQSIFVSGLTQAELFSFNRTSLLISVSRLFQWGHSPQGPPGAMTGLPGLYPFGNISGVVFRDLNANGVRDPGEPPVSGIMVRLDGGQDARTDVTGRFFFPNVVEGDHRVEILLDELPVSFNPPVESMATVHVGRLQAGEHAFGLIPTGSLSGRVEERLASGERRGLADAIVTLLPKEFSTYTDADGNYLFANLPPGRYAVRLEEGALPEGAVTEKIMSEQVELKAGEDRVLEPFSFSLRIEEKPVQPVFQKEQVIPSTGAKTKPRPAPAGAVSGSKER